MVLMATQKLILKIMDLRKSFLEMCSTTILILAMQHLLKTARYSMQINLTDLMSVLAQVSNYGY